MNKKMFARFAITGLALSVLFVPTLIASAHQSVTAGNYVVEYGWLSEPALVNQPNAVVINIGPKETDASQTGGSISFVAPTNMAGVTGDKLDVSVKVDGLDAAQVASGMHWHLTVDDQLVAMIPISQTTVSVSGLKNGMHTVTASLAAPDHADIGQPSETMIQVSGSAATTGPAAQNVESMPADMNMDFTVDVSALKVEVAYGGQTKILQLQPLADGAPGQYVASFIPTKAGQYTVNLTGKLSGSNGDSDVAASVNPEDVEPLAGYAFPVLTDSTSDTNSFGLTGWLAVGGLVAGLIGLALGAMAFTRKK